MNYLRCKTCGEFGWFNLQFGNHKCSPIWEARLFGATDDEWFTVRANDAETAAEKFCDQYDSGGDYDIIRRGSAEVEVRKQEGDPITIWDISAESVPEYRAYARPHPSLEGGEPVHRATESANTPIGQELGGDK